MKKTLVLCLSVLLLLTFAACGGVAQADLDTVVAERDAALAELGALSDQVVSLESQVADLEEQLGAANSQLEALESRYDFPLPKGYLYADYAIFNSHASDNGLEDTRIAFSGQVAEFISHEGVYGYAVDAADGRWFVWFGMEGYHSEEALKNLDLIGQPVYVYATYQGFSDVLELPAAFISEGNDHIVVVDRNESYSFNDILNL